MDDVLPVAMALIAVFPLLAFLAWCAGSVVPAIGRRLWIVPGAAALSFASSLLVVSLLILSGQAETEHLELGRWIAVSAAVPLIASIDLRADILSLLILLPATLSMTCLTVGRGLTGGHGDGKRQGAGSAAMGLFAMTMLLLSSNFIQLLVFWQWGVWAVYASLHQANGTGHAGVAARKIVLINLATDILFISGICLIWSLFGSLDFADVLENPEYLRAAVESNPAAVTVICLCLFGAAVGRCAQFPLLGWVNIAADTPIMSNALIQSTVTMPAAVYVMARCTPLLEVAPLARQTMVIVGSLTALLAAAMAVTSQDLRRLLGHTTASHFGLMFVGLGIGHADGFTAALFFLIVHMLAKSAIFCWAYSIEENAQGDAAGTGFEPLRHTLSHACWPYLVASIILFSGFWGQNALLASAWNAAVSSSESTSLTGDASSAELRLEHRPSGSAEPAVSQPRSDGHDSSDVEHQSRPGLLWLLLGISTLSLVLAAFAAFRGFFLIFHIEAAPTRRLRNQAEGGPRSPLASPTILVLAAAALGVLVVPELWIFDRVPAGGLVGAAQEVTEPPFAPGFSLPLVLLAVVWAWVLYQRHSPWPERLAAGFGPVYRLCRNAFYLDDFWFLAVILPIRGVAQIVRFVDWLLVDGLMFQFPKSIPAEWSRAAVPLQNGRIPLYSVSLLAATAILAAVLVMLRR